MKVLIDARTTQDEIKYNGVGRYSRFIIEYLIKNFADTTFGLILYNSPSTLDEFLKSKPRNVEIERIGKYESKGALNLISLNLDLIFHWSLNKVILKNQKKYDVFFAPYFWRGMPVFFLPTVVTIHDFALPRFNIYSTISPIHNILRMINYWMEIIRIYFAKYIICDSEFTKKDLFKYFGHLKQSIASVIYLGIEEDRNSGVDWKQYLPKDYEKRKYIIYLGGGLTENKNSIGVANGYADFVKKLLLSGVDRNDVPYLVIAGKNFTTEVSRDASKFRTAVDKNDVSDLIHYTGFYDDAARWPLVENAFAYIHLSTYEGFGFGVAEAMRAKTPVIAHNGSTYPEVVGDAGLLVDGKNSREVGEAIYKLYTDREYAKELGWKGYEQSKKFDWNITSKQTFEVLKSVLK